MRLPLGRPPSTGRGFRSGCSANTTGWPTPIRLIRNVAGAAARSWRFGRGGGRTSRNFCAACLTGGAMDGLAHRFLNETCTGSVCDMDILRQNPRGLRQFALLLHGPPRDAVNPFRAPQEGNWLPLTSRSWRNSPSAHNGSGSRPWPLSEGLARWRWLEPWAAWLCPCQREACRFRTSSSEVREMSGLTLVLAPGTAQVVMPAAFPAAMPLELSSITRQSWGSQRRSQAARR